MSYYSKEEKWKDKAKRVSEKINTTLRIYISGPMTGYENSNYLEFNRVAEEIKDLGFEPINPVELGTGIEKLNITDGEKYKKYMRADIKGMMDADLILMLEGFKYSRGAMIEKTLAEYIEIPVLFYIGEKNEKN